VADLDAQLQRRFDLVPNLVSTVKASANTRRHAHQGDRSALEGRQPQADRRRSYRSVKFAAFQKAQDELRGSLSRLMMIQEKYPDLKANTLPRSAGAARRHREPHPPRSRGYNRAAREYNTELLKIRQRREQGHRQAVQAAGVLHRVTEAQAAPKVSF